MTNYSYQETLITATGDGSTLTAAAAASCLPASAKYVLPPAFFSVGRMLKVRATGRISCVVTTPGTARYDIRFVEPIAGTSVVVADSLAMNLNIVAKTNVNWLLEMTLTCRAVGSGTSANLMWQGYWMSEAVIASALPTVGTSGMFTLPYNTAPAVGTGFDSTKAQQVDLFFTQTVATGSMTLHQYQLQSTI